MWKSWSELAQVFAVVIPYFFTSYVLSSSISGLELFQPPDRIALIGNDLGLPDEGNRHGAHDNEAKNQSNADVRLANLAPENATNPFHGNTSPSTVSCEPTGTRRLSARTLQLQRHTQNI